MRASLESKARKHWKEWLPKMTAELKEKGQFEQAIQGSATRAQELIEDLMRQGYQQHEAEEVALKELILLPPEVEAAETPEEREDLAALDEEYRRHPPVYL